MMPVITKAQSESIEDVIRDHHLAFKVEVLGPKSIPAEDLKRLVSKGVLSMPTLTSHTKSMVSIPAAHQVGAIAANVGDDAVSKMSDKTFWQYIKSATPSITSTELEAIDAARDKVGNLIAGLGSKAIMKAGVLVHTEDAKLRKRQVMTVRREVATGIAHRQSINQIATGLRKALTGQQRDWLEIAHTEVHNAFEEGRANAILKSLPPGSDPQVFKRPRPDACPYCKLLFLEKGKPRLFRLSELAENGTNQLRKARRPTLIGPNATEWQPVLGAVHPWCQCSLHVMPEGMKFSPKGMMVVK